MFFKVFFGLLLIGVSFNQIMAQAMPTIDAGVSRELARWRAANYSDVRYKLNLTLEKMSPILKGTVEISVKNNADLIVLDWRKIRGKEESSKISNISVNDKPAYFEELNEHLVLKEGVVKNAINVIKLDFTSPIATSGAAITRYVDKEDGAEYIYSLFVPSDASTAFPCFDQPDLKARFKLTLETPPDWKAITNSKSPLSLLLKDSYDSPVRRNVFFAEETQPISTYVFAFAAGDFAEFAANGSEPPALAGGLSELKNPPANAGGTDVASRIYVRQSQAAKFKSHAAEVFRLNREAVKYLESYFDYKFPFPKYDLVLIPEFPFGGMEHAGATFLREDRVIFPSEPTANDYITRGNLIFHEAAHQWFGDLVTMRWFDDLWLKEGFAEFMAYKTMEKVLPEYNAWKAFYERNKPLAYLTDSTKGTTPIYQEIPNLNAAKSAYGNIVYRKAPSFLRQAEFYLGAGKLQTAVRAFLKQNAFKSAEWQDLVKSFETATGQDLKDWAEIWIKQPGLEKITAVPYMRGSSIAPTNFFLRQNALPNDESIPQEIKCWEQKVKVLVIYANNKREVLDADTGKISVGNDVAENTKKFCSYGKTGFLVYSKQILIFPNYQDYGYGIFLLDERSRKYILANVQTEKDDFLRAMMWGALWDSVREAELNPKDYVELAIKNIATETDELTIQTILGRVSTAMNYYLSDNERAMFSPQLEDLLIDKMQNAPTLGQRITFYRAFLNVAFGEKARIVLKDILTGKFLVAGFKLKTKDKFDIATALAILGDVDAPKIIEELIKTETSDEAKRYAYAAQAGFPKQIVKEKYFDEFLNNKEISESWIESAFVPFNSPKNAIFTLPFLKQALAELPNLKRNRKIFFVNGWLAAFINGQRGAGALGIVNKFLNDNPNLDKDLRLKILETSDTLERAIRIRKQFANQQN